MVAYSILLYFISIELLFLFIIGRNLMESGSNLIDISNRDNYTVVINFSPTTDNKCHSLNTMNIIAIVLGAIGFLLLVIYCYFLIKMLKKTESNALEIILHQYTVYI